MIKIFNVKGIYVPFRGITSLDNNENQVLEPELSTGGEWEYACVA